MGALYCAIFEVSGDPAIGLKLGTEERMERYSPIAIAALYTPVFSRCLAAHGALQTANLPGGDKNYERGDECAVQFLWLLADRPEPATLVDACFASIVAIAAVAPAAPSIPNAWNSSVRNRTGKCTNPISNAP